MEKKYLFSETHEWVRVEGDFAYIGISTYAAEKLGEVVYVDMPSVGDVFEKDQEFGAVESVKAASELYIPVGGEVIEVNEDLENNPELLNEDAASAWIIKIKLSNQDDLKSLLTYEEYMESVE